MIWSFTNNTPNLCQLALLDWLPLLGVLLLYALQRLAPHRALTSATWMLSPAAALILGSYVLDQHFPYRIIGHHYWQHYPEWVGWSDYRQHLWLAHSITPVALALITSGLTILNQQHSRPAPQPSRDARRLLGRAVLMLGAAFACQSTLAVSWLGNHWALGQLSWVLRNAALLAALLYGAGLWRLGLRRLNTAR